MRSCRARIALRESFGRVHRRPEMHLGNGIIALFARLPAAIEMILPGRVIRTCTYQEECQRHNKCTLETFCYDRHGVILDRLAESSRSRRSCLLCLVGNFSDLRLQAPPEWRAFRRFIRAAAADMHRQLLELAARQEEQRRCSVRGRPIEGRSGTASSDAQAIVSSVCSTVYPPVKAFPRRCKTGTIEAGDHVIEKLVFESFPGYFVPALLYKPKKVTAPVPAVLSPCGHSPRERQPLEYQILHVNLARRGYVVLTYDPVGQGERSQFWDDAKKRSRFNLSCGEHAVLGNPLYLLGTSLARYRIWDGMRAIDYLTSLPEVDAARIGCVGNSGGGTLTAYIAALDPRVAVSAICCYITTLRRRMGNRIQEDPSADPEQDIFGFVSERIDHAGLLALRAPRPTLGRVRPASISSRSKELESRLRRPGGSMKSAAPATGSTASRRPEATASPASRQAVYDWFDRWLSGRPVAKPVAEFPVTPRPPVDLWCARAARLACIPITSAASAGTRAVSAETKASKKLFSEIAPSRSRTGRLSDHPDFRRDASERNDDRLYQRQ